MRKNTNTNNCKIVQWIIAIEQLGSFVVSIKMCIVFNSRNLFLDPNFFNPAVYFLQQILLPFLNDAGYNTGR